MVAYVLNSYETSSKLQLKEGAKYINTTNGNFRGVLNSNLQVELSLFHIVPLYEKDNFMTYYNTNKDNTIEVTYGGVSYTTKFKSNPLLIPLGSDLWKINAKLVGLY